jgi:hypothetical protein
MVTEEICIYLKVQFFQQLGVGMYINKFSMQVFGFQCECNLQFAFGLQWFFFWCVNVLSFQ